MNTQSLQHHGILGMHWGIRRTPAQLGKRTEVAGDHLKSIRKQKVSTLSNEEIQRLAQRYQLESSLKGVTPTALKRGENAAKAVFAAGSAIGSVYALTKSPLADDIKKVLNAGRNAAQGVISKRSMRWVL